MGDVRLAEEPDWFSVIGGPPPIEVVFRDLLLALAAPVLIIVISLYLPPLLRWPCVALAVGLSVALLITTRSRWLARQGVRVIGNVLEYRDGEHVGRVALTRALITAAVTPSGMLVMIVDDGRNHLALGRRAEAHEVSDLPPRLGPYLELDPEHFEEVRIAAHRSYPQA